MKKISFVFLVIIFVSAALHADAGVNPESTTITAVTGVSLDAQSSALQLDSGRFGISGLSFRFLDENREGIMVPVAFSYEESLNIDNMHKKISFSLNTGILFINKCYSNQYLTVN